MMAPGWLVPAVTINQRATVAAQPLLLFFFTFFFFTLRHLTSCIYAFPKITPPDKTLSIMRIDEKKKTGTILHNHNLNPTNL